MRASISGFSVQQLDLLLNELEGIAQSQPSRIKFYGALLERLRFVCSASGTAFVVPLDGQRWGVVANSGQSNLSELLGRWNAASVQFTNPGTAETSKSAKTLDQGLPERPTNGYCDGRYLVAFASPMQPLRGAVVVELNSMPDPASRDELVELCQAFAEIVSLRQSADLEEVLNKKLPIFQQLLRSLSRSESKEEAATLVVNDLLPVMGADRISLVSPSLLTGVNILAVSGIATHVNRSESSEAIRAIGVQVLETTKPVSKFWAAPTANQGDLSVPPGNWNSDSTAQEGPLAANYIAFPLGRSEPPASPTCSAAVLVEWNDYERLLQAASILNTIIPTLAVVWAEQERWLQTPELARRLVNSRLHQNLAGRSRKWQKAGAIGCGLLLIAWILTWPIDFRIEMDGVLEPEFQRTVYVAQDGVVTQVLVGDSDPVEQGQPLVLMRSPSLELQIQEVLGELNANTEKRDALSLSVNQIARDSSANPATLNRLSSEIRQLETTKETLERKLIALRDEERRLTILSPINGVVVARDLDQLLDSRPLRRGDALFRVVNPDGPWQMLLHIADADVGYVKKRLYQDAEKVVGQVPHSSNRKIEFVLASRPDQRHEAEIVWLSESARNPRGLGVSLDAVATLGPDVAGQAYVGATAHAFLVCDQRSIWFVFSRPLVESIQRKLWF